MVTELQDTHADTLVATAQWLVLAIIFDVVMLGILAEVSASPDGLTVMNWCCFFSQGMLGDLDQAMKTMHNFHQVWRQFGFTPEYYNIPKAEVHKGREGYPLRYDLY